MIENRDTPVNIDKETFKKIGHQLVDQIADFLSDIKNRPVTRSDKSSTILNLIGNEPFPENGSDPSSILTETANILFDHGLHNGHPKFMGYITSSAAPIGILADFLAAGVNPNVGAQILSPVATEIEKQTIRWLAEFIGVSPDYGGILVSGGNMANFTAFLAGSVAMTPNATKEYGLSNSASNSLVYCSKTTHTWIEKAASLFGLGTNAIRWIPVDKENKMDIDVLEDTIAKDVSMGKQPIMVIGTAGDVSTGVVDNLKKIGQVCKKNKLWFHIDGAYGMPAAIIPDLKEVFEGIKAADSIALDPHKWLYSPLEAGCTLVKKPKHLLDAYSAHPEYYNFSTIDDDVALNFYEYGLQNSRGFRSLKVWMTLKHVGRKGFVKMIKQDIQLAKLMYEKAQHHADLEAVTHNLSITTLRYAPKGYEEKFLNQLNENLLNNLQLGGELFLSNAVVQGKYCLRGCIVNFRTTEKDIEEIIQIIAKEGKKIDEQMQMNIDDYS